MKFPWQKNTRPLPKPASTVATLQLPELLQRYQAEHAYLQSLGKHRAEFLTDADFTRLRYLEEELRKRLPDALEYLATLELVKCGEDPQAFQSRDHWHLALHDFVVSVVHYLHYGEPYPTVSDPPRLFFPGNTFLQWLLHEAKTGNEHDAEANIAAALKNLVVSGSILGKPFTPKTASDFGGRIIVLRYSEYKPKMDALIAIYCQAENTQLIEEMIAEVKLTPIP